jgi:hypothetical protein
VWAVLQYVHQKAGDDTDSKSAERMIGASELFLLIENDPSDSPPFLQFLIHDLGNNDAEYQFEPYRRAVIDIEKEFKKYENTCPASD